MGTASCSTITQQTLMCTQALTVAPHMEQAKMEEVAAPKADGATPRLMITKMVLENFKSYGGVREVKKRAPRSARALFHDRARSSRRAP